MKMSNKPTIVISILTLSVLSVFIITGQAYAVQTGNTVQFTSATNVRSCAGTSCSVITAAASGSTATIIGGPSSANGYTWWNINLSGTTGWSIQDTMTVVTATPAATVSVSANPSSINLGSSFTLTWSSTNATACTGYHGGSYGTSGSLSITPSSAGTYTTGMQCTGSGGSSPMQTSSVSVGAAGTPAITSFSSSPTSITSGQSATLSWSTSNAYGCSASNGWSGYENTSGSQKVSPTQTTTYTLTCYDTTGNVKSSPQSVTVSVGAATSNNGCTAPGSSTITKTVGQTFTINWCSVNVITNCSVTGPGLSVSGSGCLAGASPEQYHSSPMSLSSPGTYDYTITGTTPGQQTNSCSGSTTSQQQVSGIVQVVVTSGGSVTQPTSPVNSSSPTAPTGGTTGGCTLPASGPCFDSFTVTTVTPNLPSCSFNGDPSSIIPPQSSTLSWSCSNAQSCSIDQGIGTVSNLSGSTSVSPVSTTTYVLSCSNPSGNNSFPATVSMGSNQSSSPFIKEIRP